MFYLSCPSRSCSHLSLRYRRLSPSLPPLPSHPVTQKILYIYINKNTTHTHTPFPFFLSNTKILKYANALSIFPRYLSLSDFHTSAFSPPQLSVPPLVTKHPIYLFSLSHPPPPPPPPILSVSDTLFHTKPRPQHNPTTTHTLPHMSVLSQTKNLSPPPLPPPPPSTLEEPHTNR